MCIQVGRVAHEPGHGLFQDGFFASVELVAAQELERRKASHIEVGINDNEVGHRGAGPGLGGLVSRSAAAWQAALLGKALGLCRSSKMSWPKSSWLGKSFHVSAEGSRGPAGVEVLAGLVLQPMAEADPQEREVGGCIAELVGAADPSRLAGSSATMESA